MLSVSGFKMLSAFVWDRTKIDSSYLLEHIFFAKDPLPGLNGILIIIILVFYKDLVLNRIMLPTYYRFSSVTYILLGMCYLPTQILKIESFVKKTIYLFVLLENYCSNDAIYWVWNDDLPQLWSGLHSTEISPKARWDSLIIKLPY